MTRIVGKELLPTKYTDRTNQKDLCQKEFGVFSRVSWAKGILCVGCSHEEHEGDEEAKSGKQEPRNWILEGRGFRQNEPNFTEFGFC
jgi:hypothetical protein